MAVRATPPGGTHVETTGWPDIGTVTNNGELDLTGNAVLSNGILKNNAVLKVSGIGNALDYETVTNAGTIEVLAGGALTIDQGSTVDNSSGNVIVDGNAVLRLDEATISGGSINNYSGVLGGKIDVTGNSKLDGDVTLNKGSVTVENGVTLTLDDATVAGAAITNGGIVKVDASKKLALNGATLTGGTLTVSGTLESTGATTIADTNISNSYLIEAVGGVLALVATTYATAITNGGTIQANGGELDINGEAVTNTGTLAAINDGTLKLTAMTVNNTGGTVSIESGSALDLAGAIIDGGTVTVSGTLESTGTSAIDCAAITNSGTISVTSGTLTIDPGVLHAITNHGLIEAATGGTLKLTSATITNTCGMITVDGASKLYLTDVSINGGSLSNAGNLYSVSGLSTITGSVTNTGTIEVQSGTLNLSGGLTGTGTLIIDDKATLELGGSVSGAIGLDVIAHGDVTITNNGHITGTASFGINIDHDDAGGTGWTHVTNAGSVVGANSLAAISIQENATGTATIDNSGTIGPTDAGTVTSTTYAIFETGGEITINNTGHINGNISVATATFNNEAGGTWAVSGTSVFGTLSTIDNDGTIDLRDGASISSADGETFGIANSGGIESWGTATITGAITNTGTIEVNDGILTLFGSLSGSGSVTIDANATLKLEGTVSQTITFDGCGAELQIDTSSFGGSIAGFAATDKIDLSTIKYDGGTSATYDPVTGNLVVSDAYGHSITLKLVGADYSNAHFAGSSDGHGGTLITLDADDDPPSFIAAEASPHVNVSERDNTTGSSAPDPTPAATGTVHFTDVDLTDRPTATITSQSVTWLNADDTTQLTLTPDETAALEQALTLQQAGKNNGTVAWSYLVADSALDFLGKGQTATVDSTITLDDHQGQKDTAGVTVTITGANDAPTLASVTTGPLVDTAVTDSFSNLTGKLIGTDADSGETATLTYAVVDSTNHAAATVAGHYGSLTVNSDGTYSYVPDAAAINALPAGSYSDTFNVQTTDVHGASGTATLTVDVTGANDAPVFNVDQISVTQFSDERVIVHGLSVTDADAAANETFTIAASTHDSGSHVSPSSGTGSLAYINSKLQTVTYREGSGEPSTDKVMLTVTDGHGATDTINLIFNLAEDAHDHVSLAGTTGKDVFFGTSYQDQFVFAANSNHDTIVNFTPHQDHIDLSAVVTTSSISDWMSHHVAASPHEFCGHPDYDRSR
ncbi:VCBS domain-containing protein [Bradyrhizobium sp. NAS80.1]|uniref:beta strand repeat-containing protein n=1 Tax=Bradyrhizobium sp. NAS80.1 TaxID=1680159 RepID=UPI001FDA3563|nr:VCBS domain-containing protein [Bradyrhizobium sp. NAS80.1]